MRLLYMVLFSLVLVTSAGVSWADPVNFPNACNNLKSVEAQKLVDLTLDAVLQIEIKGEAAFEEFSIPGNKWSHPDSYVFVHDIKGRLIFNAMQRQMVGKEMLGFRDVAGKLPVQFMVDHAKSPDKSGWIHYLWPVSDDMHLTWKSSFVHLAVAPDGSEYVVAAGKNDLPMEPCFAVQDVEDAVRLIEKEGKGAFDVFRSRSGPFVWKDSYIYVVGYDGIQYVDPVNPDNEGRDVSGIRDEHGVCMFDEMLKTVEFDEGGWFSYMWPRPGFVATMHKHSYVRRVTIDGKDYVVGCGIYLD